MNTSDIDLAFALRRGAEGTYPTEAAIQLLIDTGLVSRLDFATEIVRSFANDEPMAHLDWDIALDHPWSGGEARVMAIAHALFTDKLDVYGLSEPWVEAVIDAIRHAAGLSQRP